MWTQNIRFPLLVMAYPTVGGIQIPIECRRWRWRTHNWSVGKNSLFYQILCSTVSIHRNASGRSIATQETLQDSLVRNANLPDARLADFESQARRLLQF